MLLWLLVTIAAVAALHLGRLILRRAGIVTPDRFPSIRRLPPGYKPDGGVARQRMEQRWQTYEVLVLAVATTVYVWSQTTARRAIDVPVHVGATVIDNTERRGDSVFVLAHYRHDGPSVRTPALWLQCVAIANAQDTVALASAQMDVATGTVHSGWEQHTRVFLTGVSPDMRLACETTLPGKRLKLANAPK